MLFLVIFFMVIIPLSAHVKVPVSYGELIDKITILEIKTEKITHKKKLKNVIYELEHLRAVMLKDILIEHSKIHNLKKQLKIVNTFLWIIEDLIRQQEVKKNFNQTFIFLARCVYYINDTRARLKRLINETCDSSIVEEKSYTQYQ